MPEAESPMSEAEYLRHLAHERHMFAWCLVHVGGATPEEAEAQAGKFYKYRPPEEPYRWLKFHDEAWHWAMLAIIGEGYWLERPDLAQPSEAYDEEWARFEGA